MDETEPSTEGSQPRRPRPYIVRRLVAVAIGLALAIAAFTVSIPIFYAYTPGPVRSVEPLVRIEGAQTYSSEGNLYLTTVSVDIEVTFVDWVRASLDPHEIVVMKDDVTGGQPLEDLEKEQRREMSASKQHAEEVAFAALGLGAPTGDGARVIDVIQGSPAEGLLAKGDVIVAVDGNRTQTTCDVGSAIDRHEPGDEVEVTVRRNGRRRSFDFETVTNPDDPSAAFVGVFMEDVNRKFDPGADVTIKTGRIAGPSAGLMFTLALYDKLTPDDLTAGREIAGTGTIACDGGVGAIGGIEQKVAGAEETGAEIFLAPAGNFADAQEAAGDIRVVKVSTFQDAVDFLESLQG